MPHITLLDVILPFLRSYIDEIDDVILLREMAVVLFYFHDYFVNLRIQILSFVHAYCSMQHSTTYVQEVANTRKIYHTIAVNGRKLDC